MNKLAFALDPSILPASYMNARNALATCERVDECQNWANKAAAIASYAKQSKDDELIIMAQRIQARAIRRCGELLGQIPSAKGARSPELRAVSRTAVARSAGLSEFQQATALQVAAAPNFDEQVESDKPPTVAQLALQGRRSRSAGATKRSSKIHKFAKFCEKNSTFSCAGDAELATTIAQIAQWCARVVP